ncbi:Arm DNA-binding domain-containing protein [Undibacterium arcticum]|uniref:Arm DNA-binding domain-containing protein n=1 Tax=Undibacterium arcticum TaxID=1762892 RepID=UPI00361A27B4
MPKLAVPLTEKQVAELVPKSNVYKIGDGHGLYLLIEPTGKKRWRMIYRRLGKGTALSFGTYPEMSLTNARQQCADAHRLIADGIDPIEQKRERRKQTQAARPITRKFHFSMNDQGDMVIENSSNRLTLTVPQVAALRTFDRSKR